MAAPSSSLDLSLLFASGSCGGDLSGRRTAAADTCVKDRGQHLLLHRVLGAQAVKGDDELLGRGKAVLGLAGHGLEDDFPEGRMDLGLGIGRLEGQGAVEEMGGDDGGRVLTLDRAGTGGDLVEQHAEGVEVAARVDVLADQLLGARVLRLAEVERGRGALAPVSGCLTMPRSISLTSGSPSTSRVSIRLSGAMSRWTNPLRWR